MNRRIVDEALIAMLNADTTPGHPSIGDHKPPGDLAAGELPDRPYAVLYSADGGNADLGSPLGDATDIAMLAYQVTSVGDTPDQARWMADYVRTRIMGRAGAGYANDIVPHDVVTGESATVIWRSVSAVGGASWQGTLMNIIERFAIGVTFD